MTSQPFHPNQPWRWLRPALDSLLQQNPVELIAKLLRAWDILNRLRDKVHYHGMYEILDYDSTLKILDPKGHKAALTRREVIRFLKDHVVAIRDHAGGDGIHPRLTVSSLMTDYDHLLTLAPQAGWPYDHPPHELPGCVSC